MKRRRRGRKYRVLGKYEIPSKKGRGEEFRPRI